MTQQTLTSARYIANIKTKATLTDGAATQGISFFDIKNNLLYGCIPELSTIQKVDISVANNLIVTSSAPITPELGGVQQVALDDNGDYGYCINFNQTRLNSVKLSGELPPVAITSASDGGGGEVIFTTTDTSNAAVGHPIILDMDVGSYSGEFTVSSKTATTIGILTPFVSTSVGTWTIPDGTPFLVATDNASYSGTMQIRYIDNKAVITNKTSGIVSITDVSDPSTLPAPFEVFVTGAEGLAVKGRYAAVTEAATGAITIVDIVDYISVDSVIASNLIGITTIEWFEVGGVSYVLGYGQTNGYIICFEVLEDGAIGVSPVFEIQNDLYKLTKSVSLISNQYAISASAGATGVVVTDISDFNNVKIVKKYADDTNLNIASDIMLYGSRPFVSNRTTQTLSELDASQTHQSIAQIDVLEADNVKVNSDIETKVISFIKSVDSGANNQFIFDNETSSLMMKIYAQRKYASQPNSVLFVRQPSDLDQYLNVSTGFIELPLCTFVEGVIDVGFRQLKIGDNSTIIGYSLSCCTLLSTASTILLTSEGSGFNSIVNCGIINLNPSLVTHQINSATGLTVRYINAFLGGKFDAIDFLNLSFEGSVPDARFNLLFSAQPTLPNAFITVSKFFNAPPADTPASVFTVANGVTIPSVIMELMGSHSLSATYGFFELVGTGNVGIGQFSEGGFIGTNTTIGFDKSSDNWDFIKVSINGVSTTSFATIVVKVDAGLGVYEPITINTIDVWEDVDISASLNVYSAIEVEKYNLNDINNGDVSSASNISTAKRISYHSEFERTVSTDTAIEFGVAKNGTIMPQSIAPYFLDSNNPKQMSLPQFVAKDVLKTDTFKLQIRNRTNTNNIGLGSATISHSQ